MAEHKDSLADKILEATDIVELINEVTPLEKKGKNHMGLCPFHQENTPSFSVSEDKQLYHCFSCKASGNAITFVKETKNMMSKDAMKYLADRANITMSSEYFKDDPLQKYYDINQEAQDFYKVYLQHTKSGQAALKYLQKRELSGKILDKFDIGLAPAQGDSLYQALRKKEILKSDMQDLGLVGENDNVYDVFRNRIMFPLHDQRGRVVGFSGRIFSDDQKTAKYVNSTKTATFEKNKVLYNLHRASKAIKEQDRAVLFEGFMDVIKADSVGIHEGLATMGTALSKEHVRLISSITKTLVLCFDGDDAGQEATRSMIDTLKNTPLSIYVTKLPHKVDPDDFITQEGPEAFHRLIDEAISADEYSYDYLFAQTNTEKLTDIERFKKQIFKLIGNKSNVEQGHYLNKLAEDLGVPVATLELDFRTLHKDTIPTYKKIEKIEVPDKFLKAERSFIHYFLKDEYYARRFRSEFEDVTYIDKAARDIQFEIFEYYDLNRQSCIVPALFYDNKLSSKQKEYFDRFIKWHEYPYHEAEFEDLLGVMREYTRRNKIENLKKQLKACETDEAKFKIKKKIDRMIKEANHGKRKNYSRIN